MAGRQSRLLPDRRDLAVGAERTVPLFSAEINAAWMARLSGRNWRPWFTFTSGAHRVFTATVAAAPGLPVPP